MYLYIKLFYKLNIIHTKLKQDYKAMGVHKQLSTRAPATA